ASLPQPGLYHLAGAAHQARTGTRATTGRTTNTYAMREHCAMPESISFDPIADRYDQTRYYPQEVAEQIAAALTAQRRVPTGGTLLEVGIGTGRIALPLLARGINVTGVDISPRMVVRLQEKDAAARATRPQHGWGTLTVALADMTALPFAEGT